MSAARGGTWKMPSEWRDPSALADSCRGGMLPCGVPRDPLELVRSAPLDFFSGERCSLPMLEIGGRAVSASLVKVWKSAGAVDSDSSVFLHLGRSEIQNSE